MKQSKKIKAMDKINKEFRQHAELSLRSMNAEGSEDSRLVQGYAVKFNESSQDMGYIEIIKPEAITQETIDNSDIFALFNHDEDKVLARSRYGKGSLTLELREDGLFYSFDAPHTAAGDELLEHIRRGEVNTSSFCFSVPVDGSGDRWYKDDEGNLRRDITRIERLYDVSPVYEPAYLATTCSQRAKEVMDNAEVIEKKMQILMDELKKYEI